MRRTKAAKVTSGLLAASPSSNNRTSAAAWRERLGKLGTVSVAESQAAAARWLGASAPRTWIIVGNRAAIEPELAEVGLKALWVSPDDAVLGTFDRTATP